MRRALAIAEASYGPHPNTQVVRRSLTDLLSDIATHTTSPQPN
jgi:hypothetical protein